MEDTGLKCSPLYRLWRPDGLAYDDKLKTLYVMEFTRCSDSRQNSLLEALERKVVKYDELLQDLQLHSSHLKILQLTFAIGYLGTTDDDGMRAALLKLGIDDKNATPLIKSTVTATIAAFGKMGRERWAAIAEQKRKKREAAREADTRRR